ncbi:MAG: hypothetical protein NTX24_05180 [Candidatus Pacearchaeota archaeon]|nr:hypothetical protein [Candidatus Pacearchaeota archaeon]
MKSKGIIFFATAMMLVTLAAVCVSAVPNTVITQFTQHNESYNPVSCDRETHMAYVNYADIIGHGISTSSTDLPLLGVNYRWDQYAFKPALNLSGLITERWFTDWNDFLVGLHTICGWATDGSGSENQSHITNCCTVCIDTQAPGQPGTPQFYGNECYSGTDKGYSNSNSIYFNWTAPRDSGCANISIRYNVFLSKNSGFYIFYSTVNTNEITIDASSDPEGTTYAIKVVPFDLAGNLGSMSNPSISVMIDRVDPSVVITEPVADSWQSISFVLVENDTDATSGLCKCFVRTENNGIQTMDWTLVTCNQIYTVTTQQCQNDGNCTVYKKARDNAGNENDPVSVNVHIDNTKPTTTKTIGAPKWQKDGIWYVKSSTQFTLTCDDGQGSGCNKTYWRVDNGAWQSSDQWPITFNLSSYGPGQHTVEYYSIDNVGLKETTQSETDFVDDTAPTSHKILGDPKRCIGGSCDETGIWKITRFTSITLTSSDGNGVGTECDPIHYRVYNNGGFNTGWQTAHESNVTFYLGQWQIPDGDVYLDWYAVDCLGNVETPVHTEHDVLTQAPPQVTIVKPEITSIGCQELTFDVEALITDTLNNSVSGHAYLYYQNPNDDSWTLVEDHAMSNIGGSAYLAPFSNIHEHGHYEVVVNGKNDFGFNVNATKEFDLVYDTNWQIAPSSCCVSATNGGTCTFQYTMTLCHGGNASAFALQNRCSLTDLYGSTWSFESQTVPVVHLWANGSDELFGAPYLNLGSEFVAKTTTLRINVRNGTISQGCDELNYRLGMGYTNYQSNPLFVNNGYFEMTQSNGETCLGVPNGWMQPGQCTPLTCSQLGYNCGSASDGCGGTLQCGSCGSSQTCNTNHQCVDTETQHGGGGSGGSSYHASTASCTPQWQCTNFGNCVNELQFRVCSDLSSCGTTVGKPLEQQACTVETVTNNQNGNEAAGVGNSDLITGNTSKANPVVGGILISMIAALTAVVIVVARKLTVKKI